MKYGRLTGMEAGKLGYIPATVLLNGTPLPDCVVFDDGEGWADVYDRDRETGQIVLNETGDGPRVKRVYGEIEYIPRGTE